MTKKFKLTIVNKEVWNANMGEYTAYNILLQNIDISYTSTGDCLIKNNNNVDIDGFTFLGYKNCIYYLNTIALKPTFEKTNYQFYTIQLEANKLLYIRIA